MLHKKERMKLDAITHQRNVCHDIIAATLDRRIDVDSVDMTIIRRAQKALVPVSPRVLEILERLALQAFVTENQKK